jgi:methylmalonyl-CoA mutase cobalamin-binding domain/chain
MSAEVLAELRDALLDLDRDRTLEVVRSIVAGEAGASAPQGVEALADALGVVGRRFQDGDWFLGELVYSGEIAKEAVALLSPLLGAGVDGRRGSVVVGTVAGDLHDLGKDIFVNYAKSAGFDVIDLGVDVSVEAFARAAREHAPVALGISCLLTTCAGRIPQLIEALRSEGAGCDLKVIIGGAALTEEFAREAGADAFAPDAVTGTDLIRGWDAS